jgi:hypothetical protein
MAMAIATFCYTAAATGVGWLVYSMGCALCSEALMLVRYLFFGLGMAEISEMAGWIPWACISISCWLCVVRVIVIVIVIVM